MAARSGSKRSRKNSDADYEELSTPPPTSSRPASTRRAAPTREDAPDVLTPEEEYLLKVYRRYRKHDLTPPTATTRGVNEKLPNKRSPSPVPDRAKASVSSKPKPAGPSPAGESKSPSGSGRQGGAAKAALPPAEPVLTDTVSRAKRILMEKKRKAAAASAGLARVASVASAGAGVLRKAKINRIAGAPAASAMLDPVKYPATGLLLEREFRTFEEREEGGERVYTPVVPLIRSLANFGLPENESGKTQGNETLVMRVTVPAHSQSWGVNISPEKHSDFTDVFFHFNPRRRFVAMNNREDNIWGQQEKYMLPRWPDMFNVSINVAVQIDRTGFHVAVDGKYCATFNHRTDLPTNGSEMILQVMTEDDYGTNLGLVVHEVWWGHKEAMPGLPGAAKERQSSRSTDSWRAGDNDDSFIDLHVGNLPAMPAPEQQEAVRRRLTDMFHPFGSIQVRVFHREKSFGFIKFRDHSGASKALEELSGAEIQGRTMRLSKAGTSMHR